jgi:hypothetical protein
MLERANYRSSIGVGSHGKAVGSVVESTGILDPVSLLAGYAA